MHVTKARCLRSVLLAVAGFLGALVAHAESSDPMPSGACANLVSTIVDRAYQSAAMGLQVRVSAHETTKLLAEYPSPGWQEGNPYWEEVYAIYYPEVYQYMKGVMAREASYRKSELSKKLNPDVCLKYAMLLNSKHGAVSQRINELTTMKSQIDNHEKNPSAAKRFRAWINMAHREVQDERKQIFDDQDFIRNQPPYRKAYQEVLEYDRQLVQAGVQIGDAFNQEEGMRARQFGAEVSARNMEKLKDILQRFRASTKK